MPLIYGMMRIMAKRLLSKSFGEIVRACRGAMKVTQELLAERAGVHPTYIGMVERGERNCSLDIAAGIAETLDAPLSKLIAEAEAQNRKSASSSITKGRRL